MARLTDDDSKLGPLTWGKSCWNPLQIVFSTGGEHDEHRINHLTFYAFGYVARLDLPTKVKPYRRWVDTSHYSWSTNPAGGYWETFPREYGFSLSDGFLQIFKGAQTHDSLTTESWATHLPWTQWRHIRHSYFKPNGDHYYTEWAHPRGYKYAIDWSASYELRQKCPAAKFEIEDSDGERIVVSARIEELENKFGEGWFKWLSFFRKPRLYRKLDLTFASECGRDKGSWKGGLMGSSIELLPNETPEDALRRYCEQDHHSKNGSYRIKFVGQIVEKSKLDNERADVGCADVVK